MQRDYEIAKLELMLEFTRIKAHTEKLTLLRGFTSDSHQIVISGCVNSLAMLEMATSLPLNIYMSFERDIVEYKFQTYMTKRAFYAI